VTRRLSRKRLPRQTRLWSVRVPRKTDKKPKRIESRERKRRGSASMKRRSVPISVPRKSGSALRRSDVRGKRKTGSVLKRSPRKTVNVRKGLLRKSASAPSRRGYAKKRKINVKQRKKNCAPSERKSSASVQRK